MTVYFDHSAASNGAGTQEDPKNTVSGLTYATGETYAFKGGVRVTETVTPTGSVSGMTFTSWGDGLAVFDLENTRAVGIDCNTKSNNKIRRIRFINQNSVSNGAVKINGTGNLVELCEFAQCAIAVFINATATANRVRWNAIDVGNSARLTSAYGVRINGAASTCNKVYGNDLTSTAGLTYGIGIEVYGGVNNDVSGNDIRCPSCDGIMLRNNAQTNRVTGNIVSGNFKDGIALEHAHSNKIYINTVVQLGGLGDTYPCLKIGDDFGRGAPSGLNDIRGNVFLSYSAIPYVNDGGDTTNTSDYNVIWNLGELPTLLFRYDYDGGTPDTFYNLAQWQAATSQDANSTNADPTFDSGYAIPESSPCAGAGVFIPGAKHFGGHSMSVVAPDIGAKRYFAARSTR